MSHTPKRDDAHPRRSLQALPSPVSAMCERSEHPAHTSRGRSTSLSTAHDSQPPSSPSPTLFASASSRAPQILPSYFSSPSPVRALPSMLPYPPAARQPAQACAVPSLSTVTQMPPLRWRGFTSGPRELIESIQDLRELRHVLREERAQTLQRLQDLDHRVAAAETKIHQHLQQQHPPDSPPPPTSPSCTEASSTVLYMPSPPTSPVDSRRSLTSPAPRESVPPTEPCRYQSVEEVLSGSMDRIKIGAPPELSMGHPAVSRLYDTSRKELFPSLRLPELQPVAGWSHDKARYTPEYRASSSSSSSSTHVDSSPRSVKSPAQYKEAIVLPIEEDNESDGVVPFSASRDNSRTSAARDEQQGTSRSRSTLVPHHAGYTLVPASSRATRGETPETRRAFSAESASSIASSSRLPKRDADDYDDDSDDDSESEQPLARTAASVAAAAAAAAVKPPPSKRARVTASPQPSASAQHHQGTFTFVGTTVVPDPSRRRLVTKRQSRPGKIPCDYHGPPDEAPCPMRFTRHADMVRHRESIHGAQQGKFRCPVCGKSLSRADAVKRHILGATDYIHAEFVAKRGREIDGGGDWWRSLVEADGDHPAAAAAMSPPPAPARILS